MGVKTYKLLEYDSDSPNNPVIVLLSPVQVSAILSDAELEYQKQSPLWPLQSALRGIVEGAIDSGAAVPADVARIWSVQNDVEDLFSKWQRIDPVTLRAIIRATISPPQLDLSNSPILSGFQQALLNAPHWDDNFS